MKSKLTLLVYLLVCTSLFAQKQVRYGKAIEGAKNALAKQHYVNCVDLLVNQIYAPKPPKGKKMDKLLVSLNECHAEAIYDWEEQIKRINKEMSREDRSFDLVDNTKKKLELLQNLQKISDAMNRPKVKAYTASAIKDYTEQISETEERFTQVSVQTFKDKFNECEARADYLGKQLEAQKIAERGISKELKEKCRGLAVKLRKTYSLIEKTHIVFQLTKEYRQAQAMYERFQKAGTIRIAITPFFNETPDESHTGIVRFISTKLSESLEEQGKLEFIGFVDREVLEQVKNEIEILGVIDEETMTKFHNTYGVDYLVTGVISSISVDEVSENSLQKACTGRVANGTEKKVDKKGKEKEVTTYIDKEFLMNIKSKKADTKMSGSFKVSSMADATVLKTKTIDAQTDFECSWFSFASGSREAYSAKTYDGSTFDGMTSKECPTPSKQARVKETADKFAQQLYIGVSAQLSKISQ